MAPASGSDIGRSSAGLVFTGKGLEAIPVAIKVARATIRIVNQNFGLALTYNAIAIPIAVLGYATPLIAAIAMSSSSILVVANSLRLNLVAAPATASTRWSLLPPALKTVMNEAMPARPAPPPPGTPTPAPGGRQMSQLIILIPIALGLGALGLAAFLWTLRDGQYDDLDGAAERILNDD
jgi:cbb3-type cytochrome oxidase maturation protein